MAIEVVIPNLGITVERGKIVEWMKKEGDPVEKGETIFIVETDKVSTEVESPASGILAKILIQVDVEVPILTVVGIITEPGEALPDEYAVPKTEIPPAGPETAVRVDATTAPTPPIPTPAAPGGSTKVIPAARKLAQDKGLDVESITGTGPEGLVLVRDVEAALKSETALKSRAEGPAKVIPAARKLAQDKGLDVESITGTGPEGLVLVRDVEAALKSETALKSRAEGPAKVSPLARRVAEKEGIPLEEIDGTGVQGRVMRADVDRVIEDAATPGLGKIIPMGTMRRVIARRMSESFFTAPHIFFFTDVCMEPLLDFRKGLLPDFEKKFALRPSINDFLIKAVALNILDFPILNATIEGEEIHISSEVNIGLAVALPDGLIVPAIAGADKAGLVEISRQRKDLVRRAQSGKLSMAELERGTFTISSLSQYDITCFTAILNPPQCGILSVGKTRDELSLEDGEVKANKVTTLGLSVDHRIIDGTVAADFLQNLKWKLERPSFTFLSL